MCLLGRGNDCTASWSFVHNQTFNAGADRGSRPSLHPHTWSRSIQHKTRKSTAWLQSYRRLNCHRLSLGEPSRIPNNAADAFISSCQKIRTGCGFERIGDTSLISYFGSALATRDTPHCFYRSQSNTRQCFTIWINIKCKIIMLQQSLKKRNKKKINKKNLFFYPIVEYLCLYLENLPMG